MTVEDRKGSLPPSPQLSDETSFRVDIDLESLRISPLPSVPSPPTT